MKYQRSKTVSRKKKKFIMKDFFSFLISILILTLVWIFFTWQRLQIVWLENQISEGKKTIRQMEDHNRNLKLRRAAFCSLARVTDRVEKELGMTVMEKDQLIELDKTWSN